MENLSINNKNNLNQAWLYFMLYWLIFGVGTFLGQFIPPMLLLPLTIVFFIIILVSLFSKKAISKPFSYVFALLLGLLSYSSFMYYLNDLGTTLFYQVVILGIVVFIVTGVLGYFVFKDTSSWAKYLFVAVVVLIIASFVGIFIQMEIFHLILSILGLVIFSLYNIYDFNRLKRGDYLPYEIGFNLFINLLNIIMDLLRLFSIFDD